MTQNPRKYNKEITREFYASYVATIRNYIVKWSKSVSQPPLKSTLVRDFTVYIFEVTIRSFLYRPHHTLPNNTAEYDYQMGIIQSGAFQRDAEQRETLLTWLDRHITEDRERAEWVRTPCLEIHKRAFKATTTLPFSRLIFHLYKDASVPIWHCDRFLDATKNLDISFIWDNANLAALRREPHVEIEPLGDDLDVDVEQMQVDDTTILGPTVDTQAPLSPATSQAPSSSRATSSLGSIVVPLAQVKAIHKRLDAFELRVLDRPSPTIDVTTFQQELASLCADVAALLALTETEPESAPAVPEDEVLMTALFGNTMPPPDSSRTTGKCPRSDRTTDTEEARCLKKKECQQFEKAHRASILDEERTQQWAREVDIGPSGSLSTTEGATLVDESATDGVP
uniref:Integrase core domain containing protein n=1 Tax=Solanum tuberosum TaxID=4113 RepID=M1DA83_SOLTU